MRSQFFITSFFCSTIVLSFFSPLPAAASLLSCEKIFSQQTSVGRSVAETLTLANQTINGIQTWAYGLKHENVPMVTNPDTPVFGRHAAGYAPNWNLLLFGKLSVKYPPEVHRAVIAHEYGHIVNRASLSFPESLGQAYDIELPNKLRFFDSVPLDMSSITGADYAKHHAERDLILREMDARYAYFKTETVAAKGLDEVFADTVAVLDTGNPNAMAFLRRSFEEIVPLEGFNSVYPSPEITILNVHLIYQPSRSYLWHQYLRHISAERRGRALQAVFKAQQSERVRLYSVTDKGQLTPEVLNKAFMNALDLEFGMMPN